MTKHDGEEVVRRVRFPMKPDQYEEEVLTKRFTFKMEASTFQRIKELSQTLFGFTVSYSFVVNYLIYRMLAIVQLHQKGFRIVAQKGDEEIVIWDE